MQSMLSSTFSGALSERASDTAVDPSGLMASSAPEATTNRGASTMGQFNEAEMDFEARNWRAARDVFEHQRGHKDKKAMEDFLRQQESPSLAKVSCIEASSRASKQYAPGIGGVLSKIEAFMKVGDVAMTTAPESVGLAWMGIRLCMHSVEDDFATFNLFSGAASDIIGILISCRVYGKMYGGDGGQKGLREFGELHRKVVDYIPGIYTEILEFSYRMNKQLARNIGVRFLKGLLSSAVNKFKPMIEGIRGMEKIMREYAAEAHEQLSIHYAEVGIQKQGAGLENQQVMMADLAMIKETLNSSLKIQTMYVEQIKQFEEEKKNLKKKTPLDKAKEKFDENVKKLKPTEFSQIALERSKARKEQGTCEWIFELEEYKSWRASPENGIIRISGVGGMGKSILLSTIIDRLQNELKDSADCSLQYCICSAGDDATRLATRIKDQLLHQLYVLSLSQESPDILEKANDLVCNYLSSNEAKGSAQQKKSTVTTFEDVYPSLAHLMDKKVYLVIDALDECTDRKDTRFMKMLKDMLSASEIPEFQFHIIICSRPEADIVDDLTGCPVIEVENHNGPDIEHAARFKLNDLPGLSSAERALACEAIVKKAKGLFRCVDPAIEFLKKPLQRPLERALQRLPDGLDNSYQQILRQTDPEYLDLLKVALQWSILGQRKPTVAEVMDDYSFAYAQAEGSDTNPYDELDDPTKPEETRRLIHDQIRAAGSSTFLEISEGKVTTRHTTVADFFLRPAAASDQTVNDCQDNMCPNCKTRTANDLTWTVSQKEGHLRMAISIFKHLNSPLFRKRYLPEDPQNEDSAPGPPKQDENDDSDQPSEKQSSADNAASTNADEDAKPPFDAVSAIDDSVTPNAFGEMTEAQDPETNGVSKSVEPADDNPAVQDIAGSNQQSEPTGNDPLIESAAANQDHLNEYGDDLESDDGSLSSSNTSYLGDAGDGTDIIRPARYELTYWPYHLQAAEKLWTPDERSENRDWKELWELVLRFLCESPGAFLTWQRHYSDLDYTYSVEGVDLDPLQVAAAYGLTGLSEVLLQRGHSASAETSDGRSVLWFAANHSLDLLRLLLEQGVSPNTFKEFPTPFQRLLWLNPNIDGVKLMLDYKGDCKMKGAWELTVMHWFGVSGSDSEILKLLLENGGEINAVDDYGETSLHKLMWQHPVPLPLLDEFMKNGADVNLSDKESQQPLFEVCMEGSVDGALILLNHGADIEHADVEGRTALHIAAFYGHLEVIKLLVERKAPLLKQDKHSRTAFYVACANNHLETARYLLNAAHDQGHHESIHQAMDDGRSPFSKACGRGHLQIVRMLLDHVDADINVNAVEGVSKRTPLHWASKNARVGVVSLLLQNSADASITDANGKTPLTLSGLSWLKDKTLRREPMILTLIEHDARTASQDTDLMAIAAIRGSAPVIEKLLDAKAHPGKQDEHGWTPLQLARQYGNTDAATVLAKRGAVVGSRPSKWATESKDIRLLEEGRGLEFISEVALDEPLSQMVLANHPIPAGVEQFYFEVEIKSDVGRDADLFNAIGFATQPARLDKMPGWYNPIAPSWAFHGDDGRLFANSDSSTRDYAATYGKGAIVGCGVIYENSVDGCIFYTRDGEPLGVAFDKSVRGRLYPAIGMSEPAAIIANWGDDIDGRPFKWAPANGRRFELEAVKIKVTNEDNVVAAAGVES